MINIFFLRIFHESLVSAKQFLFYRYKFSETFKTAAEQSPSEMSTMRVG